MVSIDTTELNNALNELTPSNESEILNSMVSEFRAQHVKITGQDFQGFTPNDINYIEMLAFSAILFDVYFTIRFVISNLLLPYPTNQYLDPFGIVKNVERQGSSQATGYVTFSVANSNIAVPEGAKLLNTQGDTYTVKTAATSRNYQYTVQSVTQTDRTVRYVLNLPINENDHGMYSGQVVTLSGSQNSTYNGDKPITVINSTTIEFQIPLVQLPDSSPSALRVNFIGLKLLVESDEFTEEVNLTANDSLSLQSPITGINQSGRVQFKGITGGGKTQTEQEYKNEVLKAFKKVYTRFNYNDVFDQMRKISPALSRFELRQGFPNPGEARFYVGKASASQAEAEYTNSELIAFENLFNSQGILGMKVNGIDVVNFTPQTVNVTVSNLSPNDDDLIASVTTNIQNYFKSLEKGRDVKIDELRGVISTSTTLGGISPTGFTLTLPTADVTMNFYDAAYIGTLNVFTES